MESKLQVVYDKEWHYAAAITSFGVHTTNDPDEALSADYLSIVQSSFPNMLFRSI